MRLLPGARPWGGAALFFAALTAGLAMSGCGAKPVASVNGKALSEAEFSRLCETASQVNPQTATVGAQVLVQWVQSILRDQEARRLGVYPSDAELNTRIQQFRQMTESSGASLEDQLRQRGMSMETFRREQADALVAEKVYFHGVTINDADIRKAYTQGVSRVTTPELANIAQITLTSAESLKKAKTALDGGAQFELVAGSYSQDAFSGTGGRVPNPVALNMATDQRVSPMAVRAAFKLKEGQYSEPLKVGATWVIVKLDKKTPKKVPTFEELKEVIRSQLLQAEAQKSGKFQQNQMRIAKLVADAAIEVHRPEYQVPVQMFQQSAKNPQAAQGGAMPTGQGGAPPPGQGAAPHAHPHPGEPGGDMPPPPPGAR